MTPDKSYPISQRALEALATQISALDGLCPCHAGRHFAQAAHDVIIRTLGDDARLIYDMSGDGDDPGDLAAAFGVVAYAAEAANDALAEAASAPMRQTTPAD